jgi:hypothetical protein
MRNAISFAVLAAMLAGQPLRAESPKRAVAAAPAAECGIVDDAPIFGVGLVAGTDPSPILLPIEKAIVQRGDRSASLKSVQIQPTTISGWTTDYAMMRLSQASGHPIWVQTEDGQPGQTVSLQVPATSLADAFDRIVATKGLRWRYDGDKVYILGGREWTVPMPASRDLALAVQDAIAKERMTATIGGGMIRFQADDAGAGRISAAIANVYLQQRLNPYDVKFYKVYPVNGAIDWTTLADRTDSIESVSFEGKGATIVLDPTAGAVVDAFLAREGDVRSLGSTTMVSSRTSMPSSHVAGCGPQAEQGRGLELAGGAYAAGRVPLTYSILGAKAPQSGTLAVTPGSIVVIADGEPKEGAYMVAVVRPRVIELQRPTAEPVRPAR